MIAPSLLETPSLLPEQQKMVCKVKSNEWYTPAKYIEAARRVMGSIDLDPASCELANQTVQAARYYTERDDGTIHAWQGNIWLNPPYSSERSTKGLGGGKLRGPTDLFIAKLLKEYGSGNVQQAIALINADTNRRWFQALWDFILCFTHRPVHFYKPTVDGNLEKDSRNCSFFGSAFVYLGPHEDRFITEFSRFGTIAKRVSGPRKETQPPSLWEGVSYA